MSKIDTTGWKEFRIGDLFDVHPTRAYKLNNADLFAKEGDVPVLSNSSFNNGIGGRCGLEPLEDGGIITFSDTTTGADTMFYQDSPFIGYPHVQGMYPIGFELNEQVAMFLISVMRASFSKDFDYANKFNRTIVMDTTILLPVKESEEIDYEYMEERIRELEEERIRELEVFLKTEKLDDITLSDSDLAILSSQKERKNVNFKLGHIFHIEPAKGKTTNDLVDGNEINYVAAKKTNNGVMKRCSKAGMDNYISKGNCVVFVQLGDGSAGYTTYQLDDFIGMNGKISCGYIKDILNENIGIYLMAILDKNKQIFAYDRSWTGERLRQTDMPLPFVTDDAGTPILDPECKYHDDGYIPDFDFMERYIAAQKKLAIQSVNVWRKKEIEIAEKLIKTDGDE